MTSRKSPASVLRRFAVLARSLGLSAEQRVGVREFIAAEFPGYGTLDAVLALMKPGEWYRPQDLGLGTSNAVPAAMWSLAKQGRVQRRPYVGPRSDLAKARARPRYEYALAASRAGTAEDQA